VEGWGGGGVGVGVEVGVEVGVGVEVEVEVGVGVGVGVEVEVEVGVEVGVEAPAAPHPTIITNTAASSFCAIMSLHHHPSVSDHVAGGLDDGGMGSRSPEDHHFAGGRRCVEYASGGDSHGFGTCRVLGQGSEVFDVCSAPGIVGFED